MKQNRMSGWPVALGMLALAVALSSDVASAAVRRMPVSEGMARRVSSGAQGAWGSKHFIIDTNAQRHMPYRFSRAGWQIQMGAIVRGWVDRMRISVGD